MLQKALSQDTTVFGRLLTGSPESPAITKESVHYISKKVSGKQLIRPPWFFDITQQGQALADVGTHLVDLVLWECYPDQLLEPAETEVISSEIWPTRLSVNQFQSVTATQRIP